MEHYFRTALWMTFLIGLFQAAPIEKYEIYEINFNLLREVVEFEGNVTFKFPKAVSDSCLGEAVHTIIKGLEHAEQHANSKPGKVRCDRAIEVLERVNTTSPHNDSSDCKTQEERSLNFEDFLTEFEKIINRINSKRAQKPPNVP